LVIDVDDVEVGDMLEKEKGASGLSTCPKELTRKGAHYTRV
jgi:hypothetical protein